MKKFDLKQILVLLVLIIFSFISIREIINTANTLPKGSPENLFGHILGLTFSFVVVVCVIVLFVLFVLKDKKQTKNQK